MASRVYKRMDHLLESRKNILSVQANKDTKYIVFSDFHRGLSDRADDFKEANQKSYRAALSHYFHNDFSMIHLGDIDELKEQLSISSVIKNHDELIKMEALFYEQDRFIKVYGNHDNNWSKHKNVIKHLHPYFPDMKVYEGVLLEYSDLPNVFLVHGHQGYKWLKTNILEPVFLPIYRWYLNILGLERKTHYDSYCKIEKMENEFYNWTKDQDDLLVVFGHTHRPLWGSSTHIDALEKELVVKRKELEVKAESHGVPVREAVTNSDIYGISGLVDNIKSIIEKIKSKMEDSGVCRAPIPLPIIFNSGNCINKDGDITGIEIENGHIRLIKWGFNREHKPVRFVYENGDMGSFVL